MNFHNFSLLDVIFLAVTSKDERSHEATRGHKRSREVTGGHRRSQEVMGGHRRFKKARNKLRIQETVILQLCLITTSGFKTKTFTNWVFTHK